MVLNLFECFLGIRLIGEIWKFLNGGEWKGFMVCFLFIFLVKLEVMILGFREVVGKFLEK